MMPILLYALASATLGGWDSPLGAHGRRPDRRRRRKPRRDLPALHRRGPARRHPDRRHARQSCSSGPSVSSATQHGGASYERATRSFQSAPAAACVDWRAPQSAISGVPDFLLFEFSIAVSYGIAILGLNLLLGFTRPDLPRPGCALRGGRLHDCHSQCQLRHGIRSATLAVRGHRRRPGRRSSIGLPGIAPAGTSARDRHLRRRVARFRSSC